MGAAAHRAGAAGGQLLCQNACLCVQKDPLQPVPQLVAPGLRLGGGAVCLLCPAGGLRQLFAGGKALPQCLQPGGTELQLLCLILCRHKAGVGVSQPCQLGFGGGKGGVELLQLSPLFPGFGGGKLGGIPGGVPAAAQPLHLLIGGKGGVCLSDLPGKFFQQSCVPGVGGGIGAGSVQCRLGGGKCRLLLCQLLRQTGGVPGGTQLLLHPFQLLFKGGKLLPKALLGGKLPGQKPFQQLQSCLGGSLGRQVGKGFGVGVRRVVEDAGKDPFQLQVLGGALLGQGGVFFLQFFLQPGVALGAEQLAEDPAALLGGGVQQLGELSLSDHGDLGKLVVVQPDDLHDGGSHLPCPGHRRATVPVGQGGVCLFGGKALPPCLGAEVFRVPAHGVAFAVHLKFQLHKGGGAGVGVLAAEHTAVPHVSAGMVVEGVGDGVKKGGLAGTGVSGNKVQAPLAQLFQRKGGGGGVGSKGGQGQPDGSHASSSFQMVSMSCWQNAACSGVRGWLFWSR